MDWQVKSRTISQARYEALLREELDAYNDDLPPRKPRMTYFDAMLCRKHNCARLRWRVFKKLRDLGFSLPAIGKVSGYHHTSVLNGLYRLEGRKLKRMSENMRPNTPSVDSCDDGPRNAINVSNFTVAQSL